MKTPKAPDPVETANAQGAVNAETARTQAALNRIDQVTPYGTLRYRQLNDASGNPIQDKYEQYTELTPAGQRQLEQEMAFNEGTARLGNEQLGRVQNALSTPFSLEGLPQISGQDDLRAQGDKVADAMYGQATSRLDPQFAQRDAQLKQSLFNRGLAEGTEAYKTAYDNLARERNDAYGSARNQAIAAGGAEQNRLFGLENTNRQNALAERQLLRAQPLNEASALMGASGGVQMPQFSNVPQVGVNAPDLMGQINSNYQTRVGAASANNQAIGSLFGTVGASLPWASIFASDIRLKQDIVDTGSVTPTGFAIYEYAYKSAPETRVLGVMAQEVEQTMPDAVVMMDNGFKAVNYGMVM